MGSEIRSFLNSGNSVIRPIGVRLSANDKLGLFDLTWDSYSIKVYDAKDLLESAITSAKTFCYEAEVYAKFIQRLQEVLLKNLDLILSAYSKGTVDRAILENRLRRLDDLHHVPYECVKIPVILRVCDADSDALFHLSRLLHVLSAGYQEKYSAGVVLVCQCRHLLVLFHIVSLLIAECNPPSHIYSFIPISISQHITKQSFDSLVLVFKTADIDAAARSCLQSLSESKGTKRWKSKIILIEESVESHFVRRLKRIIEFPSERPRESSLSSFLLEPEVANSMSSYIRDLQESRGIKVIEPKDGNLTLGPVILTDVVPSFIKDLETFCMMPVACVLRFRTLKEAMSIASYVSATRSNRLVSFSEATGDSSLLGEVWSDSCSTAWRASSHLSACGVDTVFVNSPYREKTRVVYELLPDRPVFTFRETSVVMRNGEFISEITSLLTLGRRAQEIWYEQGFDAIQEKLRSLHGENPIMHVQHLSDALESAKCLTKSSYPVPIFPKIAKQNTVFESSFCYFPVGPIIMALSGTEDKEQSNSYILHIICALACGNSVLILIPNDAETDQFVQLVLCIQKSVPENLLLLHKYESMDESDLPSVLSSIRASGCYLLSENLKCSRNASPDVFGSLSFVRRATIFWSLAGDSFSD
ncbi:hypothetical protein FBUS_04706 [Fasciolopsis buskii]|uniref:Aldehyde dehydrogenase domain-containing protein n=1 Tax=Fasciolopsis buskii TaxID=27845 RepID=A0A8E0S446_9TREM|nr:hypothetical protein FBUS_04706 [Fasciolopsis buski]